MPPVAEAHHLLPQTQLRCSANFKCPEALHPRVRFWVAVFSRWDKKQAILHDSRYPFRVYKVLNTGHGCGRAARKQIRSAQEAIRTDLRRLASELAKGRTPDGPQATHLLGLFSGRKPSQLRASANNLRCQTGVRDQFEAALPRFERYRGIVDAALERHNLPPELRYLPFVESSYNPRAYSKAGAAGLWQLMPAAARENGLELNATLDERLDVVAATDAAARYLVKARRSLTGVAKSINPNVKPTDLNPFIITSYNYGVTGMRRAIRQHGPDYLKVLNNYKSPNFQVAVKNFYASFLAASHLAGAGQASARARPAAARDSQTVVLRHATSARRLREVFGLSTDELRRRNPGLSRYVWEDWRLIPAGYGLQIPARGDKWQAQLARLGRLQAESAAPGSGTYRVRRGDTACGVARALRVNCGLLMEVNRLNSRGDIHVGQNLLIPQSADIGPAAQYRVRSGDTACGIAQRHSVSCRELVALNRLGRKAKIVPGQMLQLPQTALGRATRDGLDRQGFYVVRRGDSVCEIARRYDLHCPAVQTANRLTGEAKIFPGQKLVLPGLTEVPEPTATTAATADATGSATATADAAAAAADAAAVNHPLDELPDLAVRVTSQDGEPRYSVRVEPEETLGYYTDWAGLGSSAVLRRHNNLGADRALPIGRLLYLPLADANQVARFEEQRREFHQTLGDGLKSNYELVRIIEYRVRAGDSPFELARTREFPLWLLYRLNPQLHDGTLQIGQVLRLPELGARG